MLVLKLQPYPSARPILDDEALQFAVVDEGAWFLYRVRGRNWKYRSSQSSLGSSPAQIQPSSTALDDDASAVWTTQQWAQARQPSVDDDDLPLRLSATYDEDHWISGSQQLWPASKTVIGDDGDLYPVQLSVDDDDGLFAFRNRKASWRLFYPSRRGGSTDSNQTYIIDDDPWRAIAQKTWAHSRPFDDDEILSQAASTIGVEDDGAFTYRNRVAAWKIFYPSRRGGSPDSNAAVLPLGVEDDPWEQRAQRVWKLSAAFSDDEVYVVNVTEDYLWIATQSFFESPLVATTDDEIIPTAASLGIEDDAHWHGDPTVAWKLSSPFLDDEISWFETPPIEPPPTGQVVPPSAVGGDDVPRRRRKSPDRGFDLEAWKARQLDFEGTIRETYEALMRSPNALEAEEAVVKHQGKAGIDWPAVYRDARALTELIELRRLQQEEEAIVLMLLLH